MRLLNCWVCGLLIKMIHIPSDLRWGKKAIFFLQAIVLGNYLVCWEFIYISSSLHWKFICLKFINTPFMLQPYLSVHMAGVFFCTAPWALQGGVWWEHPTSNWVFPSLLLSTQCPCGSMYWFPSIEEGSFSYYRWVRHWSVSVANLVRSHFFFTVFF